MAKASWIKFGLWCVGDLFVCACAIYAFFWAPDVYVEGTVKTKILVILLFVSGVIIIATTPASIKQRWCAIKKQIGRGAA